MIEHRHGVGIVIIIASVGATGCRGNTPDARPHVPPALAIEADYSAQGKTICDPDTGKMVVTVSELCAGDCIAQHEAIHVRDIEPCCTALKACIGRGRSAETDPGSAVPQADDPEDATRKQCIDTYNAWHRSVSNWTECNADKAEVACIGPELDAELERDSGSVCSVELESALKEATTRKAAHCKVARPQACPFK